MDWGAIAILDGSSASVCHLVTSIQPGCVLDFLTAKDTWISTIHPFTLCRILELSLNLICINLNLIAFAEMRKKLKWRSQENGKNRNV